MEWLDDGMFRLDEISKEVKNGEIKQQIMRHKEFQKELREKQPMYDSTMKTDNGLTGKAPKTDEPIIKNMMTELKNKCQFKDALKALMDWLANMEKDLVDKQPVHGDMDTVTGLVEQHKNFEEELNSRTEQVEQLKQAEELLGFNRQIAKHAKVISNRKEGKWDLLTGVNMGKALCWS